jgi:phenylalanyl-tRNA synthetase beta chain
MAEEKEVGIMPVINFNKKYLHKLLGSGIDDASLKSHVEKMGFEIEGISTSEISLEITPNRLDLLDAVGFARAMKHFLHKSKKFTYRLEEGAPSAFPITVDPSVNKIRPFISGLVAQGVELDEESLQNLINFSEKFCDTFGRNRRKIAIGIHNLDRIKPPLVYRCGSDEKFVALGAKEAMNYSKILNSTEKGKEYSNIVMSGKVCYYPELIDGEGAIAFIPILNSERTKITTSTKNIFVDITGTSVYAVNKAADLLAATFTDMGARIKRVHINYQKEQMDTPELAENYIVVPLAKIERSIGVVIGFNNIISLANKMGYEAALVGNNIRFTIPEYRLDIIDEQDIVEDIAIAYGYDYIKPIALPYTQRGGLEEQTIFNRRAAEIAVGLGFSEFANSYLTNEEINFERMGVDRESHAVMLKNPKTEAISIMRTWLLPSILKNLGASTHDKLPQNVFELDMVFKVKGKGAVESYNIAAATIDPKANFNDSKASVEGFLATLGIKYNFEAYVHKSFIEGRCAAITVNEKHVGFFGELHPKVLKAFGIEEPGTAFEIELDKLHKND